MRAAPARIAHSRGLGVGTACVDNAGVGDWDARGRRRTGLSSEVDFARERRRRRKDGR